MDNKSTNTIWNLLCSVKLTIFLLVLLAGTSIIGTIIPQEEAGGQLTRSLGPIFEKIVISLRLFDMYHSSWFQLIIFILAMNLIACSINKIPGTIKLYNKKPSPDREKIFSDATLCKIPLRNRTKTEILSDVEKIARKQYSRTTQKDIGKIAYLYGDKGRYSLFGVYLVHFSILLILTGAIIGSFFGFKGYVNILEGESVDSIITSGGNNHRHRDLGFTISCDKFTVDFYENGMPREFKSDIRFSVNGETAAKGHLLVNHPLTFKGITFYQASYGAIPGDEARITVNLKDNKEPFTINLMKDKPVSLPGSNGVVILEGVRDDFMRMGPAVLINIKPEEGSGGEIWLFKHHIMIEQRFPSIFEQYPKFNPSAVEPYTFTLDNVEMVNYTGLQVNKDPGIFFIYTGFFTIVIGLFVTFFSSHRRVWIKIMEDEKELTIAVAGIANKNPVGIERELSHLADRFKTKFNGN